MSHLSRSLGLMLLGCLVLHSPAAADESGRASLSASDDGTILVTTPPEPVATDWTSGYARLLELQQQIQSLQRELGIPKTYTVHCRIYQLDVLAFRDHITDIDDELKLIGVPSKFFQNPQLTTLFTLPVTEEALDILRRHNALKLMDSIDLQAAPGQPGTAKKGGDHPELAAAGRENSFIGTEFEAVVLPKGPEQISLAVTLHHSILDHSKSVKVGRKKVPEVIQFGIAPRAMLKLNQAAITVLTASAPQTGTASVDFVVLHVTPNQ